MTSTKQLKHTFTAMSWSTNIDMQSHKTKNIHFSNIDGNFKTYARAISSTSILNLNCEILIIQDLKNKLESNRTTFWNLLQLIPNLP